MALPQPYSTGASTSVAPAASSSTQGGGVGRTASSGSSVAASAPAATPGKQPLPQQQAPAAPAAAPPDGAGLRIGAQPFAPPLQPPQQQQQQPAYLQLNVAAQGFSVAAPSFVMQQPVQQQPVQQVQPLLPPHLQQVVAGGSSGVFLAGPTTPLPPQHSTPSFVPTPQQLLPQLLGAGAPRPAVVAAAPQQQQPAATGNGFSNLSSMLAELTATAAPPPARPAYRPPSAYCPPLGTAAPPAPSPAARFPMPGPAHPAAAPPPPAQRFAAAAAAPPPASATAWDCGLCSYRHEGAEAQFLACAMCGTPQQA